MGGVSGMGGMLCGVGVVERQGVLWRPGMWSRCWGWRRTPHRPKLPRVWRGEPSGPASAAPSVRCGDCVRAAGRSRTRPSSTGAGLRSSAPAPAASSPASTRSVSCCWQRPVLYLRLQGPRRQSPIGPRAGWRTGQREPSAPSASRVRWPTRSPRSSGSHDGRTASRPGWPSWRAGWTTRYAEGSAASSSAGTPS